MSSINDIIQKVFSEYKSHRSIRGMGRGFFVGGEGGALGTYLAGQDYDALRRKGLSHDEARDIAIRKAGKRGAITNAITSGASVAAWGLRGGKKYGAHNMGVLIPSAALHTAQGGAGAMLGASKRIRSKREAELGID